MTSIKSSLLAKGVIIFILLSSTAMIWNVMTRPSGQPQELAGVLRAQPKTLETFELVDQNGTLVNDQIFKDKWSFVFFGYTSCPDICPTTLHVLNTVMDMLGKQSGSGLDVQTVFVSVDPARDTTEKLSEYMDYFNKDFIGLTGDKEGIDNITQQFGAGYMMEEETSPGHYAVGHTSAIFLVDKAKNLVAAFSLPHYPETIISQYQAVREYILR